MSLERALGTPSGFILLSGACLLSLFLFTGIYRLAFHPLAKYPGPILARVTAWHNWYHAAVGDRHLEIHKQHQRYGPIIRFRPDSVSINSSAAIAEIYGSRKANVVKSDWYRCVQYTAAGYASTFTMIDRNKHATKRRLLSHAFSDKASREMEPRVEARVGIWLEQISTYAQSGKDGSFALDMGDWASYLIFDILADLCFGKPLGVIESSENRYLIPLIPQATKSWYTLGYHPMTQLLRRLLFKTSLGKFIGGKPFRDNKRFRAFCAQALKERREQENGAEKSPLLSPPKDFFHYLLNGRDPITGVGYAQGELESESVLLVVAGSDASSAALAACFFYLVHNEEVLSKLADQIRSTFPSANDIHYPSSNAGPGLTTIPYLRACIDESLRLTPPTPGHLPREVLSGGAMIDGAFFPKGTIVGTAAYAIHHNETYFPNPYKFYPERWLVDPAAGVTAESVAAAQSAFCPFSTGSRGCIGKQLAYMELSLAVAKILWIYDVRAKVGIEQWMGEYRGWIRAWGDGQTSFNAMTCSWPRPRGRLLIYREEMVNCENKSDREWGRSRAEGGGC